MQTNESPNSQTAAPGATAAQANNYGASPTLLWSNTVIATIGAMCGVVALVLTFTRLNVYAEQIALEKRLNTQALDECRVEANVSRKLAGLPVINSQEHD